MAAGAPPFCGSQSSILQDSAVIEFSCFARLIFMLLRHGTVPVGCCGGGLWTGGSADIIGAREARPHRRTFRKAPGPSRSPIFADADSAATARQYDQVTVGEMA